MMLLLFLSKQVIIEFIFGIFLYYVVYNTEIYLKKKNVKREYGRNRYHITSEEKLQRLEEYQKNYRETKNSNLVINIFYGSAC